MQLQLLDLPSIMKKDNSNSNHVVERIEPYFREY